MKETGHTIFCDKCDAELQDWRSKSSELDNGIPKTSMSDLISNARTQGWSIGKRDLCSNCRTRRKWRYR